ncbi:MAG: Do family serine endopeptidase [Brevinematia bacterium]
MKVKIKFIILSIVVAIFFGSFIACKGNLFSKNLEYETKNKMVESMPELDTALKLQNVYRNIARSIMPAVVNIQVEGEQIIRNPYSDFFNDPFFRRFFGDEFSQPREFKRRIQATGSGIIITKDGYIFSNHHVVKEAKKIYVFLSDNRRFEAKVVGADPETDIALLKIDADNLPVAPIGNSDEVEVGDFVVAIGNPFNLSWTYTTGIVSAIGRKGMVSGFQKFIQTDAAVNPGNSGGPLVNIKGQVIGINTAIQSQTGGYQGISFAVPINIAKNVARQLLTHGSIERGFLGINIMPIDDVTRKALGLDNNEGVMVANVEPKGPADRAGIKKGDIITKIEGKKVGTPEDLMYEVGNNAPGSVIKVEVIRNKKRMEFSVKLKERPSQVASKGKDEEKPEAPQKGVIEFLGARFSNAPKELLDENSVEFGVVVESIKEDSPLYDVLEPGLIIVGINDSEIRNVNDLRAFVEKNKNERRFVFLIARKGMLFYRGIER